jgi:hypothetical protein
MSGIVGACLCYMSRHSGTYSSSEGKGSEKLVTSDAKWDG